MPERGAGERRGRDTDADAGATPAVCRCNGVTKSDLVRRLGGTVPRGEEIAATTRATTGCGGCSAACAASSTGSGASSDGGDESQ